MGKGDKKTKRGKIAKGSFGVSRPRTAATDSTPSEKKEKPEKKKSTKSKASKK